MTNRILWLICSLFCSLSPLMSQDSLSSKGILFEELSLENALAKAGAEGKKVFVDCYTQTCGPCKYMMKNIFPLKECGDYFNPRFISLTMDMDIGEGPYVGKKYDVGIYPTFLILNPDGSLYCKEIGAVRLNSKISFVEKMKQALERAELAVKYENGNRDAALVRRYVELLKGSGDQKADEVLNSYLESMSVQQLCSKSNWDIIVSDINSPSSPVFRKLLTQRAEFEKMLGKETVEEKLMSTYKSEFEMYKMIGLPFASRIADLKELEKDGYKEAIVLQECMTIRWIINEKKTNRIGEIIGLLQKLESLPTDVDRMSVISELRGFERVANASQRAKACVALKSSQKNMSETDAAIVGKTISRIMPKGN